MCIIIINHLLDIGIYQSLNKYFINDTDNRIFGLSQNYSMVPGTLHTCQSTIQCLDDACLVLNMSGVEYVVTRPLYVNCNTVDLLNIVMPGLILLSIVVVLIIFSLICFCVNNNKMLSLGMTWLTAIGVNAYFFFILAKYEFQHVFSPYFIVMLIILYVIILIIQSFVLFLEDTDDSYKIIR